MAQYRPYKSITAHGLNVSTLNALYRRLHYSDNEPDNDLLITIIVFLAFSIESYVNHLGADHLSIWDELERLPWKKKITILHKIRSKTPDWGSNPLQFANKVFSLRDRLAHGKPEIVYGPVTESEEQALESLDDHGLFLPEWRKQITREWIIQSEENYKLLIDHFLWMFRKHSIDSVTVAFTGVEEVEE